MAETKKYDLVVIGSGPGGYVAAIRAAQLGMKTAIVEKWQKLGGTCLNIGCIPSKALLDTSELFYRARHDFAENGIKIADPQIDLKKVLERKQAVVQKLTSGVALLMKHNRIDVYHGTASIPSTGKVSVAGAGDSGNETIGLDTARILVATGSVPTALPPLPFDGRAVVSSEEALSFDKVPKRLVVVGAGAIGLELGSVWMRLGSEVTVVEIMSTLLPGWDVQTGGVLKRELTRQGMKFLLETKVTGSKKSGRTTLVTAEGKDGAAHELSADKVLVSIGRKPYFEGLGLEALGVELEEGSRRIRVDGEYRTSVDGIFAIGDVVHGPMLAHKAEDEGVAAVERMAGVAGAVEYDTIPGVVYTWPEVAMVGKTEEVLKSEGVPYRKGSFQFAANGRALAMSAGTGMVKILAHADTDRILGVHIIGPYASDLISEAVVAMVYHASSEDLARTVHAHPTLSEVVREAALAVDGRSIHSA